MKEVKPMGGYIPHNKALFNILCAWSKYQKDKRPETRNDFLRVFSENERDLGGV